MAKSNSKKRPAAESTTSFSKKNKNIVPAKDNHSKIKPTKDADMDVMELDPFRWAHKIINGWNKRYVLGGKSFGKSFA
jgi:hypothetical protein